MATQQVSVAKPRSSDGCWTCRLRRKKCDEVRPVCIGCSALEIDCLYSDTKPEWMDGAEKQKEKGEWLKLEVKRLAAVRRERRHLQSLEVGIDGLEVSRASDATAIPALHTALAGDSSTAASNANDTAQDSGSESWMADRSMPSLSGSTPPSSFDSAALSTPSTFIGMQVPVHRMGLDDRDLSFVMMYLDYTFPLLNPFYRPNILDGGRGWLLVVMMRNKALFHAALSLSSYLFAEIMKNECAAHTDCLRHNWEALQEQQQLAMRELQADMHELNQRGVQGYLTASGQVMGSVMQLLSFEVAIANTGNWQMHLDAASELFEQIMEHHGTREGGGPCWHRVLCHLGDGVVPGSVGEKHRPWSPDQASLRFFTASLIFFDTISATALGRAPRLSKYHDHLLTVLDHCCDNHPTHPSVPHLRMDDFFGVPNRVIQCIAATASLQAWKTQQNAANSLSITQLVSRAASIQQTLGLQIAELDTKLSNQGTSSFATMSSPLLFGQAAVGAVPGFPPAAPLPLSASLSNQSLPSDLITARIWAQAAVTYLLVTVSGWQPANPEIRESVSVTTDLLRRLPAPAGLRSVVWPFAVTGCLAASPRDEQGFRDLVAALGPLQIFGTVREALAVMEEVWAHRECIGRLPDSWDLSVGLNNLGHPSLLI